MTEKRFVNIGNDILQYGEWYCSAKGEHCADVIATALNQLIEENEQLKKEAKHQQGQKQRLYNYLRQYLSNEEIREIANNDKWLSSEELEKELLE